MTCESLGSYTVTLKGIDSLRVAANAGSTPYPNAAIHLIALDSSHLVGVFKCNSCTDPNDRDYKSWEVSGTAAELSSYLTSTNLPDFENSTTDADYLQHGQEPYLKLFRDESTGQLSQPEAEFRKFILQTVQNTNPDRPSIFVRLLPGSSKPLFSVPLGLMAVPNTTYYSGNYFRLETPFESQTCDAPATCISQRTLLIPPDVPESEDPMQQVREPFQSWITSFSEWNNHAVIFVECLASTDQDIAPVSSIIIVIGPPRSATEGRRFNSYGVTEHGW